MRDIPYRNMASEPREDKNGVVDAAQLRKYNKKVADDLRTDLATIDKTTPDVRNKVTFKTDGESKMTVNHGQNYVPVLYGAPTVRFDDDDLIVMHEYRDASKTSLYLRIAMIDALTSEVKNPPKGVKITAFLHPKDG